MHGRVRFVGRAHSHALLRADARGSCKLGSNGQEEVVLLGRADRDAHAHAEGAHDETDARARLDEAVEVASDQEKFDWLSGMS